MDANFSVTIPTNNVQKCIIQIFKCTYTVAPFWLCLLVLHSWAIVMKQAFVIRPSVRRHRFLGHRQVDWHQILLTRAYPPYIVSPDQFCFIFIFFIFYNCFFFHMGEKNSIDISESTHRIHSPKIMHTPRQGLYQSCSIFRSIFDFFFLFVFVNIWPYGGKTFKRHLVWTNTHLLHKIRAYSWGGSQPKMLK